MTTDIAMLSKAGGRNINEDYCHYGFQDGYCCCLLADGLGGHKGGEIAAKVIGEAVMEAFTASPGLSHETLIDYLEYARRSFAAVSEVKGYHSMKATLVVLITDGRQAYWGHIGDSRLYFFRSGKLHYQTRDHSVPQKLAESGEIGYDQIRYHEDRNRLTAAFDEGSLERFEYLGSSVEVRQRDVFLLCSDGFWEHILETEMEYDLAQTLSAQQWLLLMEKRLLKRVKAGHDNYSALSLILS